MLNREPETLTGGTGRPLPGALAFQLLYEPETLMNALADEVKRAGVKLWVSATTQ